MAWTIILFLIYTVVTAFLGYLLHNSNHYDGTPFTMPLLVWVLLALVAFIPVLNIIAAIIYIVVVIHWYGDFDLSFKKDFWLAKRY